MKKTIELGNYTEKRANFIFSILNRLNRRHDDSIFISNAWRVPMFDPSHREYGSPQYYEITYNDQNKYDIFLEKIRFAIPDIIEVKDKDDEQNN